MQTIDEPRSLRSPEPAKLDVTPSDVVESDGEGTGEKKAALRYMLQEDLTEMPSRLKNAASVPSLAIQNLARQIAEALGEDPKALGEDPEAAGEEQKSKKLHKAKTAPGGTLGAAMEDARESEIGHLLLQPPSAVGEPLDVPEFPSGVNLEPIKIKADVSEVPDLESPPSPKTKLREALTRGSSSGSRDQYDEADGDQRSA